MGTGVRGGERTLGWTILSAGVSPRPEPRHQTMLALCACPIDSGGSGTLPRVTSMGSPRARGISLMGRQELLWLQTLGQRAQYKHYNRGEVSSLQKERNKACGKEERRCWAEWWLLYLLRDTSVNYWNKFSQWSSTVCILNLCTQSWHSSHSMLVYFLCKKNKVWVCVCGEREYDSRCWKCSQILLKWRVGCKIYWTVGSYGFKRSSGYQEVTQFLLWPSEPGPHWISVLSQLSVLLLDYQSPQNHIL